MYVTLAYFLRFNQNIKSYLSGTALQGKYNIFVGYMES